MSYVTTDGASIYYEVVGDRPGSLIVLIQGYGSQLTGWDPRFVERLAASRTVVLLDNRDAGLSIGPEEPDYSIADMADDVIAVVDAEGGGAAHIVGQSLGGVIAQAVAARHPERVRSLSLFYTLGDERFALIDSAESIRVAAQLREGTPAFPDRETAITAQVGMARLTASPLEEFDAVRARARAEASYDRQRVRDGHARQSAALLASRLDWVDDIRPELPAALIHGRADALIDWRASAALAERLAESELHVYPGVGHEFPISLVDEWARVVVSTVERADRFESVHDVGRVG